MVAKPQHRAPLAVSVGEPAGIGIDCLLLAWQAQLSGGVDPLPPFLLIGDPEHLSARAAQLGVNVDIETIGAIDQLDTLAGSSSLLCLPLKNPFAAEAGSPNPIDADGVVEAISTAVELVKSGHCKGIMTLPINKKSLYDSGFEYPGHTEFLAALSETWPGVTGPVRPVMMLAGPTLRAVPVTIHIPLKQIADELTIEAIFETAQITHQDLKARFGIYSPRLAISGLNPHAGESGALGNEDRDVIVPAIDRLQQAGIQCFGPLPADTMFHASARSHYDAAICMYHDQALIPAKALAFDETVNVTLGLPFVRTSPDHGTAYDIAGTGKANPASTVAALRLADSMTRVAER